jgi:hypothetical protein
MAKEPAKGSAAARPASQKLRRVSSPPSVHDPLSVPAIYATMTACMVTTTAVRLSFGESSPDGSRFHSAVAMDREVAEGLLGQLERSLRKQSEPGFKDDILEGHFGDD